MTEAGYGQVYGTPAAREELDGKKVLAWVVKPRLDGRVGVWLYESKCGKVVSDFSFDVGFWQTEMDIIAAKRRLLEKRSLCRNHTCPALERVDADERDGETD